MQGKKIVLLRLGCGVGAGLGCLATVQAGYRRPRTSFSLCLSGMACTVAGQGLRETRPAQVTRRPLPTETACSPCFQGLTSLLLSSREGMKRFLNQHRGAHECDPQLIPLKSSGASSFLVGLV